MSINELLNLPNVSDQQGLQGAELDKFKEKCNKAEKTFENGGITQNSTLQPQFFLGGSVPSQDPNNPEQDTSIKIPMYQVKDNKVKLKAI